jgi:hypothetical protein
MNFKSVMALTLTAGAMWLPACGGDGATTSACGHPDPAPTFAVGDQVTGCVGTADGSQADLFAFSAPASAAGGYVLIQIDEVSAGTVRATIYGSDDSKMWIFTATAPGAPVVFHLAAAPGATYHLAVEDGGDFPGPYTYRLTSTFSPIADTFEPNDTPDRAAPITVGTPAAAFLYAGAATLTPNAADWDDYYRFEITASQPTTVRIDDVPTDLAVRLFLYGADQMELARISTGHKGEALVMQTPAALDPGQYLVRVAPWTDLPAPVSIGAEPPDHFTRSYQLTVTQP